MLCKRLKTFVSEINYTQWAGIIGAGIAMLSCLLSTWRFRSSRQTWPILALFYLLFLFEMLLGYRHDVHDLFENYALPHLILYAEKQTVHIILIIIATCLAILTAGGVSNRIRSRPATEQVAIFASLMVFFLTIIEGISLNAIDAILYKLIGPIIFIGWLWIMCCTVTTCAALLSVRSNLSPEINK